MPDQRAIDFRTVALSLVGQALAVDASVYDQLAAALASGQPVAGLWDWFDVGPRSRYTAVNGLALIPVKGMIFPEDEWWCSCSYPGIKQAILDAEADPNIAATVLIGGSSGGTVAGSANFAAWVAGFKGKPMYGYVRTHVCSAAYDIFSNCKEIGAAEDAKAGSVGTRTMHVDWSKALEMMGMKIEHLYRGEHKIDGAPDKPLSDGARESFNRALDLYHEAFVKRVAKNRQMSPSKVRATEADVFVAPDALSRGLIDHVMPEDDFLEYVLTKIPKSKRVSGASSEAPLVEVSDAFIPAADTQQTATESAPAGAEEQPMFSKEFLASLGLSEGATADAVQAAVTAKMTEAASALTTVNGQVTDLNARLKSTESERDTLKTEAASARLDAENLRTQVGGLQEKAAQVETLQASLKEANEDLAAKDALILEKQLTIEGFSGTERARKDACVVIQGSYLAEAGGDISKAVAAHKEATPGLYGSKPVEQAQTTNQLTTKPNTGVVQTVGTRTAPSAAAAAGMGAVSETSVSGKQGPVQTVLVNHPRA